MSKTKKLTRLRKRASLTICIYCGHETPNIAIGVPNRKAIFEHMVACDQRPEARMIRHILLQQAAIKWLRVSLASAHSAMPPGEIAEEIASCLRDTSSIENVLSQDS